jgi:hypothetical protein
MFSDLDSVLLCTIPSPLDVLAMHPFSYGCIEARFVDKGELVNAISGDSSKVRIPQPLVTLSCLCLKLKVNEIVNNHTFFLLMPLTSKILLKCLSVRFMPGYILLKSEANSQR